MQGGPPALLVTMAAFREASAISGVKARARLESPCLLCVPNAFDLRIALSGALSSREDRIRRPDAILLALMAVREGIAVVSIKKSGCLKLELPCL